MKQSEMYQRKEWRVKHVCEVQEFCVCVRVWFLAGASVFPSEGDQV